VGKSAIGDISQCQRTATLWRVKPSLSKEVDDGIWLVTLMDYDLGYIDLGEKPAAPKQPFWPKGVGGFRESAKR